MSHQSGRRFAGVDVEMPSAARIYDYALGGAHNFAADRAAAEALFKAVPDGPQVAWSNRTFLQRAVRYCVEQGVRQFLDLGSGIPTVGNVHEIAHQLDPEARVVYVDNEPVAVETTRRMLDGVANAAIVHADVRDAGAVLSAPETHRLLDFNQPVGLMMVAVLHYVSVADDANALVARYVSALSPGSFVVVSHTTEHPEPDIQATIKKIFAETSTPVTHRSRAQVAGLFTGLELVEPGVVWTPEWRPSDGTDPLYAAPERSATFAAVGRVPTKDLA